MNEWKKLLLVPRIEFFMNEEAAREEARIEVSLLYMI